jgi:hypothetical protein
MRIVLSKLDRLSTVSTILPALSQVTAINAEVLKQALKACVEFCGKLNVKELLSGVTQTWKGLF